MAEKTDTDKHNIRTNNSTLLDNQRRIWGVKARKQAPNSTSIHIKSR